MGRSGNQRTAPKKIKDKTTVCNLHHRLAEGDYTPDVNCGKIIFNLGCLNQICDLLDDLNCDFPVEQASKGRISLIGNF